MQRDFWGPSVCKGLPELSDVSPKEYTKRRGSHTIRPGGMHQEGGWIQKGNVVRRVQVIDHYTRSHHLVMAVPNPNVVCAPATHRLTL